MYLIFCPVPFPSLNIRTNSVPPSMHTLRWCLTTDIGCHWREEGGEKEGGEKEGGEKEGGERETGSKRGGRGGEGEVAGGVGWV